VDQHGGVHARHPRLLDPAGRGCHADHAQAPGAALGRGDRANGAVRRSRQGDPLRRDDARAHLRERAGHRADVESLLRRRPRSPQELIFWRVTLPFLAGYFVSYVCRSINAIIGPALAEEFGLSAATLGLLTGIFFFSFAAFQLPLGVLLDRYGPRRV